MDFIWLLGGAGTAFLALLWFTFRSLNKAWEKGSQADLYRLKYEESERQKEKLKAELELHNQPRPDNWPAVVDSL